MTISYLNGCIWNATSGGAGAFTVSSTAVSPYFTPAQCTNPSVVNVGTYNYFAINGTQFEVGQGVYTASGTTLTRASIFSSSNGGASVIFSAAPTVFMGCMLANDLVIGRTVEAWSANLDTLASPGNWNVTYSNGSGVQTALTVGAVGTALCGNGVSAAPSWQGVCLTANNLSDVTAATARTNLGLAIGTNVEAWNANLDTLSSGSVGNWKVTYTNGSAAMQTLTVGAVGTALCGNGVAAAPSWQGVCLTANNLSDVTAATARANLGLAIGTTVNHLPRFTDTAGAQGGQTGFSEDGAGNLSGVNSISVPVSLGIGTTSPGTFIDIVNNQNAPTILRVKNTTNDTSAYASIGLLSDNALSMYSIPSNYTLSPYWASTALFFTSQPNMFLVNSNASGVIKFGTGGLNNERMRIDSTGFVGVGVTGPVCAVDVNGPVRVKSYTVGTLPAANVGAGQLAWVTDGNTTTRGSTVTGGGSTKLLVGSDGTNWLSI